MLAKYEINIKPLKESNSAYKLIALMNTNECH